MTLATTISPPATRWSTAVARSEVRWWTTAVAAPPPPPPPSTIPRKRMTLHPPWNRISLSSSPTLLSKTATTTTTTSTRRENARSEGRRWWRAAITWWAVTVWSTRKCTTSTNILGTRTGPPTGGAAARVNKAFVRMGAIIRRGRMRMMTTTTIPGDLITGRLTVELTGIVAWFRTIQLEIQQVPPLSIFASSAHRLSLSFHYFVITWVFSFPLRDFFGFYHTNPSEETLSENWYIWLYFEDGRLWIWLTRDWVEGAHLHSVTLPACVSCPKCFLLGASLKGWTAVMNEICHFMWLMSSFAMPFSPFLVSIIQPHSFSLRIIHLCWNLVGNSERSLQLSIYLYHGGLKELGLVIFNGSRNHSKIRNQFQADWAFWKYVLTHFGS